MTVKEKTFNKERDIVTLGINMVLGIGLVFLNPLLLMFHWNWFVVPILGLVELTYVTAFGLMIVVWFLTKFPRQKIRDEPIENLKLIISRYVVLTLLLIMALIIRGMM
ncbi:hypothetical protein [Shouchella clausii]|uniref:Uncharacterized protein n=1 Tax=Shouchella clausii TaxID=79880 RepID=A0A268NW71_SHOCL|nr:hypothetical protein [Shouchella clausii]PAE87777.1 hypothetical protein CHH72_16745 [Shouchella clausii]